MNTYKKKCTECGAVATLDPHRCEDVMADLMKFLALADERERKTGKAVFWHHSRAEAQCLERALKGFRAARAAAVADLQAAMDDATRTVNGYNERARSEQGYDRKAAARSKLVDRLVRKGMRREALGALSTAELVNLDVEYKS